MSDLELRRWALELALSRNLHTGDFKRVVKEAETYYEFASKGKEKK